MLSAVAIVLLAGSTAADPAPPELAPVEAFLRDVCPLPRYEERNYHPLGRSPVIDS